jgi:hypothetical protein
MKNPNLKIIKKVLKQRCWCCGGKGCKVCDFSGVYKENYYYHVFTGKDGKQYCLDGDSLK